MKPDLITYAIRMLLPVAWLSLTGCSSTTAVDKTTIATPKEGLPGGSLSQVYQTMATVSAIDQNTRQVTLIAPDASRNTFMAGPKVALDEMKVGEVMKVTVARQLVMYLDPKDVPTTANPADVVSAVPGVRPGVLVAGLVELTATVESVDESRHEATLQISDGRSGTFKIRPDVDLAQVKPGAKVFIRTRTAIAVMMENPGKAVGGQ